MIDDNAGPAPPLSTEQRELRMAARGAVSNAIRAGRLIRQPCERCGVPEAQAHHDDYSKPLDVRWLCQEHHNDVHREIGIPSRPRSTTPNRTKAIKILVGPELHEQIIAAAAADGSSVSDWGQRVFEREVGAEKRTRPSKGDRR